MQTPCLHRAPPPTPWCRVTGRLGHTLDPARGVQNGCGGARILFTTTFVGNCLAESASFGPGKGGGAAGGTSLPG